MTAMMPLSGSPPYPKAPSCAALSQQRAQDLKDLFSGTRRHQKLGDKVLALFEQSAHFRHRGTDALADEKHRVRTLSQSLTCGGNGCCGRLRSTIACARLRAKAKQAPDLVPFGIAKRE
jgi:hypothetical protein